MSGINLDAAEVDGRQIARNAAPVDAQTRAVGKAHIGTDCPTMQKDLAHVVGNEVASDASPGRVERTMVMYGQIAANCTK